MSEKEKVSEVKIESGEKIALCRCWASEKFPYCDGSHRKLNLEQGPIIVQHEDD